MKFPKIIYVQIEQSNTEDYLVADKDVEKRNDGKVGVYELKKIKQKITKVSLI